MVTIDNTFYKNTNLGGGFSPVMSITKKIFHRALDSDTVLVESFREKSAKK